MYFIINVCLPAFIPPKDTKPVTVTQTFFFLSLSILSIIMLLSYV